jgi:hypothetical protein
MAFQVNCENGSTVVVVQHPRLAAVVRAIGYMWDDVTDEPAREAILAEMIEVLEQFSERFPQVLGRPGARRAAT